MASSAESSQMVVPSSQSLLSEAAILLGCRGVARAEFIDRTARAGAPEGFQLRGLLWRLCLGSVPWPDLPAASGPDEQDPVFDLASLADVAGDVMERRSQYLAEKTDLLAAPTTAEDDDPLTNNPLLFTESSPWAQFYRNKELLDLIKKDVERLYLDDCGDYFQVADNQNVLTNILFVWSKRHPEVSYRQGMHELLATLMWQLKLDSDQQHHFKKLSGAASEPGAGTAGSPASDPDAAEVVVDGSVVDAETSAAASTAAAATTASGTSSAAPDSPPGSASPETSDASPDLDVAKHVACLIDAHHLEPDAFMAFERLMSVVGHALFGSLATDGDDPEIPPPPEGESADVVAENRLALGPSRISPVLVLANSIQHRRLRKASPAAHRNLVDLGVEPQLYCLRWTRLIFSREFPLAKVQMLWDVLFARHALSLDPSWKIGGCGESWPLLKAIEWMACAMLLAIEKQLCDDDYSTVLGSLMRYPAGLEPIQIFHEAVQLEGNGGNRRSQSTTHARSQPSSPSLRPGCPASMHDLLVAFYEKHNPDKVRNVDRILTTFEGRELALMQNLHKMYGTSPVGDDPHACVFADGMAYAVSGGEATPSSGASTPSATDSPVPLAHLHTPSFSTPSSPSSLVSSYGRSNRPASRSPTRAGLRSKVMQGLSTLAHGAGHAIKSAVGKHGGGSSSYADTRRTAGVGHRRVVTSSGAVTRIIVPPALPSSGSGSPPDSASPTDTGFIAAAHPNAHLLHAPAQSHHESQPDARHRQTSSLPASYAADSIHAPISTFTHEQRSILPPPSAGRAAGLANPRAGAPPRPTVAAGGVHGGASAVQARSKANPKPAADVTVSQRMGRRLGLILENLEGEVSKVMQFLSSSRAAAAASGSASEQSSPIRTKLGSEPFAAGKETGHAASGSRAPGPDAEKCENEGHVAGAETDPEAGGEACAGGEADEEADGKADGDDPADPASRVVVEEDPLSALAAGEEDDVAVLNAVPVSNPSPSGGGLTFSASYSSLASLGSVGSRDGSQVGPHQSMLDVALLRKSVSDLKLVRDILLGRLSPDVEDLME